ncbi:FecR family protein [Xanthobacter dioxanivorans]|uniref:FecR family protein n=1 Tax=Xanthobacter dioxanivorans TaxID=2528964 RepID=UPI001E33AD0A|nr:FecR domain-containing protein [Xanthobacter dioxanivorans]
MQRGASSFSRPPADPAFSGRPHDRDRGKPRRHAGRWQHRHPWSAQRHCHRPRGERRHVTLLSGEAFFEVTPDASRPFVVAAGGVDVTVLGTAFNVALSADTTAVELAHGSVRVAPGQAGGQPGATLTPGETVVVDRGTGAMQKETIALDDIAAWRNGQIFVNDATIGSVVERLRRYHRAWISLPDAALAAQRVTGLYDLRDPDRALRALVQPYGGQVHEISPYLRVVSRL